MVWPLMVVVPLETVTVPSAAGIPVYGTLPSGPSW